MNYPAPSLTPDAKPVDVIASFLSQEDETPIELWKYCVEEWQNRYYAFDPESYFTERAEATEEPEEETAPEEVDLDEDETDEDEEADATLEEEPVEDAQVREQLIIYAPLIAALKSFWLSMMVFTEDNPAVANWNTMCERMERFIAHVPVDRDRFIRHVRRLDQARMEAESMKPQTLHFSENTVLFEVVNNTWSKS